MSVFEVTIRCLGGLLSAYHLTRDPFLLHAAEDLGARLSRAFVTPTRLPVPRVNLRSYTPLPF